MEFKKGNIPWNKGKKDCEQLKGEKNWNWKGKEATYKSFHYRVYRAFGKAWKCENPKCAYENPKRYEWANITGNYHDLNDYMQLCPSCHRRFDGVKAPKIKNTKKCKRCEKVFMPRCSAHVYCGDRKLKEGCAYLAFNEYHRLIEQEKRKLNKII